MQRHLNSMKLNKLKEESAGFHRLCLDFRTRWSQRLNYIIFPFEEHFWRSSSSTLKNCQRTWCQSCIKITNPKQNVIFMETIQKFSVWHCALDDGPISYSCETNHLASETRDLYCFILGCSLVSTLVSHLWQCIPAS